VPSALDACLRKVVSALDERRYRYAIIGGIALSHWGVVRATYDVDIKVMVPDNDYAAMRGVLRAAFPLPARQDGPLNPLIVAVAVDGVTVDFLLALPGYEELIIERAVRRDMGGWTGCVCSAEDLIVQKVVAGREKDWLDVQALLTEQHGCLDEGYVSDWLRQFAEALEDPEIPTRYQRVVASVEAAIRSG
jgi:predicted nucleotidyltransferase